METILQDLALVGQLGSKLGLKLNYQKSELFCSNDDARAAILSSLHGAKVIDLSDASLLGSPIGSVHSIDSSLGEKIELLRRTGARLSGLLTQDTLLLLRHSFVIPNLLYILRTSPCFFPPLLSEYDSVLRSISSDILNIHFPDGDSTWIQVTLPVHAGGLGIRRAVQLAPSAFLASAAACSDLVYQIVPYTFHTFSFPH